MCDLEFTCCFCQNSINSSKPEFEVSCLTFICHPFVISQIKLEQNSSNRLFQERHDGSETHHITQSLQSEPKDFTSSVEEEIIKPESVIIIAAAPPSGRKTPQQLMTSSERNLEEQIAAASRDIRPEVAHLYDLSKDELVNR